MRCIRPVLLALTFLAPLVAAAPGMATLSWRPPIQNTDGTTLTNLAGYIVEYGTSSNNLATRIKIASPGLASYVVDNLSPGTYYFGVRAYTTTGAESSLSNVAFKTISGPAPPTDGSIVAPTDGSIIP